LTAKDLSFINHELKAVTEPGEFTIQIANQKINFNYAL
jgi:beta-glucosidase